MLVHVFQRLTRPFARTIPDLWQDQSPIRADLFGAERLEHHAQTLAAAQPVRAGSGRWAPRLDVRVRDNAGFLLDAYKICAQALQAGETVTPAADVCNHTGYHGRVGVYELLTLTDEIRNLIVERATHSAIRTVALRNGMRTMQAEAFGLVAEGVTTVDEVLRSVYAPMDELPVPAPVDAPPVDLGSMATTLSLAVSDAAIAINEGSITVSEGIA
ncbi:MAG: hypothetical protein V9G14_10360 [Cypionkella sp.]